MWLAAFSLKYPRLVLAAVVLSALVCVGLATGLRFDFGLDQLAPDGDQEFARYRELATRYGRDDDTIFVFLKHPRLFSREGLNDVVKLHRRLQGIEGVDEVTSLASAPLVDRDPAMDLLFGSGRIAGGFGVPRLRPAFDAGRVEATDFDALRRRVLSEPLYRRRLVSDDGLSTALVVTLSEAAREGPPASRLLSRVRAAARPLQAGGREVLISGSVPVRESYLELLWQDFVLLAPLCLAVMASALFWCFRSWAVLAVSSSVVVTAQLWMFGLMAGLGLQVTLLSPTLPVLVVVIGSSDAVHLLARYALQQRRCAREAGGNGSCSRADKPAKGAAQPFDPDALRQSLGALGPSLAVTSVTTAVGFLALRATAIPMLWEFGFAAALGVASAYVATLLLVPAMLLLIQPALGSGASPRLARWIPLSTRLLRRPRTVILATLASSLLLAATGLPLLRVESQVVDDVSVSHPIRLRREAVEGTMGGNFPMTLLIHPRQPERDGRAGPIGPDLLRAVLEFEKRLLANSEGFLSSAISAADLYGFFWRGLGHEGELPASTADTRRIAALIGRERLASWVDFNSGELRIDLQVYDRGTHATHDFIRLARDLFLQIVGNQADLEVQGFVYLAHRVHREVASNALRGFAASFLAVILVLGVLLRSWKMTLLAVVPNLVPLMVVLGVMGLAGIELRVSTCIVFTAVFGIAVDDTVHFLAEHCRGGGRELPVPQRIRSTLLHAGPGIIATSIVLGLGFLTLLAGQFHPSQVVGGLVALTALSALVADLLLLPALLSVSSGWTWRLP